jgi:hypothetical protein
MKRVSSGFTNYMGRLSIGDRWDEERYLVNPLTPELNRSAQRCLTRFFTGVFSS